MSIEISCPKCGATMVRRRRGRDGAEFWGCPRFPSCRGTVDIAAVGERGPAETSGHVAAPTNSTERPIVTAAAGGSARADFQRRRDRDRERLRRARPTLLAFGLAVAMIGLLLTAFGPTPPGPVGPSFRIFYFFIVMAAVVMTPVAMFALPASTIAWRTGAVGEERTGELLLPLEAAGFCILHDRAIPRSRANIDHIVVGPPGAFIVETKNYERKLSRRRKEQFADQAKREAAAVAAVVAPLAVTPVVCVHRADLGWFKVVVDGVRFVTPRELIKVLRKAPVQLSPEDVARIVGQVDLALKPAGQSADR